jgi:hypothetical protein
MIHDPHQSLLIPLLATQPPEGMYITVPQLLAVLLMVGGIGVLLWAFRRVPSSSGSPSIPVATPPRPAPGPPEASISELQQVMSDSRELADLLAERLDRQAQRLEELIAHADGRIRRIERMLEREQPRGERLDRPIQDPLNQQVYELSDQGLPAVEIARQLKQHTGKVELILALRRR